MFVGVEAKDLVSGTKYVTLVGIFVPRYYTATYIYRSGRGMFYHTKEYSGIQYINTYNILLNMKIKNKSEFFVFVPKKEKIQQAMEQRALNKILKRLVNDEFQW